MSRHNSPSCSWIVAIVAFYLSGYLYFLFPLEPRFSMTEEKGNGRNYNDFENRTLVDENGRILMGIDGKEETYEGGNVFAPSLHGYLLEMMAKILSPPSVLGPLVTRRLLDANGLIRIRELASNVRFPPLSFPMVRVSDSDWINAQKHSGSILNIVL